MIGIVETHINPELLSRSKEVKENIFRSDINNTILTNNGNELIDARQQGGVLYSVRGELSRFTRASGVDETMLGRWKWIELFFHERKIRFITAYNCKDSRSSGYHNAIYSQQRHYVLKIDRYIFP